MKEQRLNRRREAFERDALPNIDALLRAAVRITRSAHEGEDAVQDTFLRAWKHFDSFEIGTNCRAWLFRILFNVIKGRRSKQARRPELPLDEVVAGSRGAKVVVIDVLKRLEGREVLEMTQRLSDGQREVLWLVVVEEFSYLEAAQILEVPIGTVMSRLHRARTELRRLLSKPTNRVRANGSP